MVQIYNTLTRQKEEFKPMVDGKIDMYVCGITIYDYCHIGHARTFVGFDVIVRYLRHLGYDLKYVRNITDVDDKIIKRANENGEAINDLTVRMTKAMHEDFDSLNMLRPDIEPTVTGHMDEIIAMVERLIAKGHAYVAADGDVLFDVSTFEQYGALSQQDLTMLQSGSRVEVAQDKDDPLDFVLWKKAKAGEPSWSSPWGEGRPGWHIECSAMSSKHLGEHFDIHGGGSDLQFPHHENEIAQSCCANNGQYVNTWIHTGMVQVNKEKMSKSLDNFFTVREVLKQYDAESVRYFLISGHYRSQLNYSQENLDQARSSLERIYTALRGVEPVECVLEGNEYVAKFRKAMNDDFNSPEALPVVFEVAKELNRVKDSDSEKAGHLAFILRSLGEILGIAQQAPEAFLQGGQNDDEVAEIEALIVKRNDARASKNWAAADEARDALNALGVVLEDSAGKTTWRKA
ncbi:MULTISPECIES: cysteine--tRNA ligase [Pseudoalteromonas]|jgi:cysteinyl-tRNA synthetase|uniref:Cysteine--tRNA ligase n=1 Tax=Pseudoalteromonas tetraodonis TaxID=43659 RepID=A0ABD4ES86_9GAMM|nr:MULTISPECIES: cysteine--tRNA ligase [Pseudoalteromonas]KYL35861.1 cysteine--tRNA ligase [Pseudoalteromonas spiralis]MDN3400752.1 cysteine--tRNA ligase [Pseudoalteromonas sp. APC 3213]MDN3406107.1 cysteine--tRNA ligase [Pseudoalteromonas sp. APC 3218]MDN3408566.1 cysteine--tRNA ligase [Pseudoalteromonas sp. APC 3894]MDN3415243.1 cysteine--tRNA ligase [Pseudoalteromonas sp. APC 3227]|tara:strand:+ start:450 stop:1829 length:1380 start_codon:yes stop_codon:yes gene_type:complete